MDLVQPLKLDLVQTGRGPRPNRWWTRSTGEADRIEDLHQSYVTEKALWREIDKKPFLATGIKDTELPEWLKDAMSFCRSTKPCW